MVYAKDSIWMGKWYVRGKPGRAFPRGDASTRQPRGNDQDPGGGQAPGPDQRDFDGTAASRGGHDRGAGRLAPHHPVEGEEPQAVDGRELRELSTRSSGAALRRDAGVRDHGRRRRGFHRAVPCRAFDQEHAQLPWTPARHLRLRDPQALGVREPVSARREAGAGRRRSRHPLSRRRGVEALLEAAGVRYRHNPETLQRAARVRTRGT